MAKKKITTIVNFILDESGSMNAIKKQTIDGFNEYINGLKKQKANVLFTLTTFETGRIEQKFIAKPIKEVEPLTDKTYNPGGGTPLYDAAVTTMEKVAAEVEKMEETPAVLVVMMTDGEENASTEYDEHCLKDLIQELEKKGNYTFVYMGANQDAWANAQKFGISKGNTYSWDATPMGAINSMQDLTRGTKIYASAMASNYAKGEGMTTLDFADMMKGGVDKNDTQS